MFVVQTGLLSKPRYIVNFPTKRHWKDRSRLEDIESGLKALVSELRMRDIRSVAIPALGCGNGGLDWVAVSKLIEDAFADISDVSSLVYEPA